jgi:fructose/tagatose bisphosphate aldolase
MARISLRRLLDHAAECDYAIPAFNINDMEQGLAMAATDPSEFDPRKFLKPAMNALTVLCRERFEQFGAAGNAVRLNVTPLSEMASRYRSGRLDPRIDAEAEAAA